MDYNVIKPLQIIKQKYYFFLNNQKQECFLHSLCSAHTGVFCQQIKVVIFGLEIILT